ncbi:MAG: hypothetical protein ACQERB_13675 [Promethearchaeati archaeon]
MFNIDDFEAFPELHSEINKLNKYIRKDKRSKLTSLMEDFKKLLKEERLKVPITYVLSIVIEEYPEIYDQNFIQIIEPFINSEDLKLKLNSIIILGFFLLSNPKYLNQKYSSQFIELLSNKDEDIRENCYYFLKRFLKLKPELLRDNKNELLEIFDFEIQQKKIGNIILLIKFLKNCEKFKFKHLYRLRNIGKEIVESFFDQDVEMLKTTLGTLLCQQFPELKEEDFISKQADELKELLENTFIKKRYNYTQLNKKKGINFNEFLESFKDLSLKDVEIYFYTKNQETKQIYFYELEKEKLNNFFSQSDKVSYDKILEGFSEIINKEDLKLFIKTLVKLGHIQGYLSEFYFYPANYIKSQLIDDLQKNGVIDLKDYNHLPLPYVKKLIKDVIQENNFLVLLGREKEKFFLMDRIQKRIVELATKETYIDLKDYQTKLTDRSFIKLIKHLPKEYLTNFHERTFWLTNIGKLKIERELENTKIIGYFDVNRISEKFGINKILLYDIFDTFVDERSGLWNKERTVFYYSKYLKERIDSISKIQDKEKKAKEINIFAQELNINKEEILLKIAENTKSIGEEIKSKDQIKISEYLTKTGMEYKIFLEYLNELNLNFLIQGDTIIFNPSKIENAKNKVKEFVKTESQSQSVITLGTYDINSQLMKNLIEELQQSGTLKGIFYEEDNEVKFYTEKGIKEMMISSGALFSFNDLFYGKELTENDLEVLMDIFNELRDSGGLEGEFDEETYTFTRDEIIFAKNYISSLEEFEIIVNNYYDKFNREFQKIKTILTKDSTIYPQEIKIIHNSINRINERYIHWRSELDAIINRLNKKFLEEQGYSLKKYKAISYMDEDVEKIKSFAEDEKVKELMDGFNLWIKLFNQIELKYQNILFYQKRLINNPEETKTKEKLRDLREKLNLI